MIQAFRACFSLSTLLMITVSGQYQPFSYQDYYNVPQDYSNLPNYYEAPSVQDYAVQVAPEYGYDYSEDYSLGRYPDGTIVEGALPNVEDYDEGDDYGMVKIPKINDKCILKDCKGKKYKFFSDKAMAKKNFDFLKRNHILAEILFYAKKMKCKKCLCNVMDEYAHYTGEVNQESGICEPHHDVQHCNAGPEVVSRRRRRRKAACILPAPINNGHHDFRRKSGIKNTSLLSEDFIKKFRTSRISSYGL